MMEGLQSRDSAVRCLTRSWIHHATSRGDLPRLLEPLLRILLEPEGKRKTFRAEPLESTAVPTDNAGKYYYNPTGSSREVTAILTQAEEIQLVYIQVYDTDQVLYALSLLQAVLMVKSVSVISSLASSVISVGALTSSQSQQNDHQRTSSTSQKTLLEVILLSLVSFLRSDYPKSLHVSHSDVVENLRVKATALEMISFFMSQLSKILSSTDHSEGNQNLIHNPSYVSALVTLCNIQTITLLLFSKVVNSLKSDTNFKQEIAFNGNNSVNDSLTASSSVASGRMVSKKTDQGGLSLELPLRVVYIHLLRCLQSLIALETQCISSSSASNTPSAKQPKKSFSLPLHIEPGVSCTAQPFFQSLLTEILADNSLSVLHLPLLHMFSACLPHLHNQLDDLAPKVLRQLCQNLELTVQAERERNEQAPPIGVWPESTGGALIVSYLQVLVDIVLWCLFGEFPIKRASLWHDLLNQFWDAARFGYADDSEESASPTSKQPSTMSWLFGIFSSTGLQGKAVSSPVATKTPKLGLASSAGRSISLLLPAIHNAVTEVWVWFSGARGLYHGSSVHGKEGRVRGRGRGKKEKEKEREREREKEKGEAAHFEADLEVVKKRAENEVSTCMYMYNVVVLTIHAVPTCTYVYIQYTSDTKVRIRLM